MATQTVEFRAATGLTIVAKLFAAGSDTEVASVTATEATNRKGTYSAAYTDVAAGEYQLIALNSGTPVASWWTTLTLSTATFGVYDKADTRDINTRALDIQSRIPDSLENGRIKASIVGTGTGARTVTITVNDGAAVLQNATVRLSQGVENYVGKTNSSGVIVFAVDDATWDVAITKSGYRFTPTTLVVDGTETRTYSMTARAFTPSEADKVTGYWTVLDEEGNPAVGVVVKVNAVLQPTGAEGIIHFKTTRSSTTGANGVAEFVNMLPGWTYNVSLDGQTLSQITIDSAATGNVSLGSCVLAE